MRLSLLTAGPGSQSLEQKWALRTQHFAGSWNDPAGVGSVLSVPNGKWDLCPSQGSAAWGSSTPFFRFFSKFIFSLSCRVCILYYLPLTTNISEAGVLCLLALNSSALTGTLYFCVCWPEISSQGGKDSNCLLGDFTSTNSFHVQRGFLMEPEETNLHPGLHPLGKSRLQWQLPVYNPRGPFLFSFFLKIEVDIVQKTIAGIIL